MKVMRPAIVYILLTINCSVFAYGQDTLTKMDLFGIPDHPRLLLLGHEEQALRENIGTYPVWNDVHQTILDECNDILDQPPVERIQIGRRLLDKSRTCLQRTFFLSYAFRMTGNKVYAERARQELLQVCGFTDWNPSHFLDVAEMTMAVALGYDWLYDFLPESDRIIIRTAVVDKGLRPSFDPQYNWFLTSNHNWNQVCNAGMTFGALAIAEEDPDLALRIINRAIASIRLPMEAYGPDGAYPEGYAYWDYGTSFNVLFINALVKAFKSDFALTEIPGFLETAGFMENMTGTTGLCFNWGDSHLSAGLNPAMFWLAAHQNDPSLLWVERKFLEEGLYRKMNKDRIFPALILWGSQLDLASITPPKSTCWTGQGQNPVCLMRTSWSDPDGIYLGFKAGSPIVNHAHMDIGSFVMEAMGIRWASDLGMQNYESLESKGIELWGRTQDAQRWTIKRLNNFVHNTWTFDDQIQRVDGYARIDQFSTGPAFMFAVSDLSPVYAGQVVSLQRGVAIKDQSYVIVRDEVQANNHPVRMRWSMLTTCQVTITPKGVQLNKDGQWLLLKATGTHPVHWQTWSTEPTNDYDAPNPGTVIVGFEIQAKPGEQADFEVLLVPQGQPASFLGKRLSSWR